MIFLSSTKFQLYSTCVSGNSGGVWKGGWTEACAGCIIQLEIEVLMTTLFFFIMQTLFRSVM